MYVLLILSPMTNLIIKSSFEVGFYSSALFLVFQVSIKGWKGNFSFKLQKLFFKEKKHKWPFSSIFTPNFTVSCMKTNHTAIFPIKAFFLEFDWLFPKWKEIITNVVFFGNFILKIFAHSNGKGSIKINWLCDSVNIYLFKGNNRNTKKCVEYFQR